jgi:CubicO group peptidase (beta-lactamase class C family)
LRHLLCGGLVILSLSGAARADKIDDVVQAELAKRQVPGLSLAIIQDGKIVKVATYGVTEVGGAKVTPTTLFQAGSISKPVTALAALILVERGKLALDEDVNAKLTTWKVPASEVAKDKKVTLRRLLSHGAGLTVHGFPGYAVGEARPTVAQVLDGEKPANTPAIRVDLEPGTKFRYSGGGYTVVQELLLDVTAKPFPRLMRELVLGPLGMTQSTYEQPLPRDKAAATATGHLGDRTRVEGRWHIYPEMAAAGLWTTPSDLARFAIGVQQAAAGKGKVLSRELMGQMLTRQMETAGLGLFLEGTGRTLRFGHDGRDEGFDAFLTATAETGQGAVIMINANDNSGMVRRIARAIAREYHWPEDKPVAPVKVEPVAVEAAALARYAGRYEFSNNNMWTFMVHEGHLYTQSDGLPDEELVPVAPNRFAFDGGQAQVTFSTDAGGAVGGFTWAREGKTGEAPRIGPLVHALAPRADPDPTLTHKIEAVMLAFAKGATEGPDLAMTAGARRDLKGPVRPLAGMASLAFVDIQDVAGRGLERHDGKVARVAYYRLVPDAKPRHVLVHLTADGLVTDFDLVDD